MAGLLKFITVLVTLLTSSAAKSYGRHITVHWVPVHFGIYSHYLRWMNQPVNITLLNVHITTRWVSVHFGICSHYLRWINQEVNITLFNVIFGQISLSCTTISSWQWWPWFAAVQLELQLCFIDFKLGRKATLILDMSDLNWWVQFIDYQQVLKLKNAAFLSKKLMLVTKQSTMYAKWNIDPLWWWIGALTSLSSVKGLWLANIHSSSTNPFERDYAVGIYTPWCCLYIMCALQGHML